MVTMGKVTAAKLNCTYLRMAAWFFTYINAMGIELRLL